MKLGQKIYDLRNGETGRVIRHRCDGYRVRMDSGVDRFIPRGLCSVNGVRMSRKMKAPPSKYPQEIRQAAERLGVRPGKYLELINA